MPYVTDEQNRERAALAEAIACVTTKEPRKFANQIHDYVVRCNMHKGTYVEWTIDGLDEFLAYLEVYDGARTFTLSEKQQKVIREWVAFALRAGATFSPYREH